MRSPLCFENVISVNRQPKILWQPFARGHQGICHLSAVFSLAKRHIWLTFSHLAGGYVSDTLGESHTPCGIAARMGIEYCRLSAGIGAPRMDTALGGECHVGIALISVVRPHTTRLTPPTSRGHDRSITLFHSGDADCDQPWLAPCRNVKAR